MSVLIKGMEMPTSCSRCPMLEGDRLDGLCHAASRWLDDDEYWTWYAYPEGDIDDSKPCNCPLVELPPHGRLIDADALRLLYDFSGYKPTGDMTEEEFDRLMYRLPVIRAIIDEAPTIIEAEEGE